jgi:WD40 repeat protein
MKSSDIRATIIVIFGAIMFLQFVPSAFVTSARGASLTKVASFSNHTAPVTEVRFAPGQHQLASATKAGAVYLWDYQSGERISKISFLEHNTTGDWFPKAGIQYFMKALGWNPLASPIVALSYAPKDHQRLAVGYDFETTARIFNPTRGAQRQTFPAPSGTIDLEFSPEGVFLSIISEKLTVWNTKSGKVHRKISGPRFRNDILPVDLEYSPRGKYLAVSWLNGEVVWWKARTGKMVQSINLAEKQYEGDVSTNIKAIDIHPSARRLLAITWDEQFEVWSFPEGKRLFTQEIPGDYHPQDIEYSPQGNIFAIAQGKEISFWESKTRKLLL